MATIVCAASAGSGSGLPLACVDRLRMAFPSDTFVHAQETETFVRSLSEAEVVLTTFIEGALVPHLPRLRWIQCPTTGVAALLSPELVQTPSW